MNQAMIHPGVEKRVTRKVEVAPDLTAMAGTVAEEIALAAGAGTTAEVINNLPAIKQIQKSGFFFYRSFGNELRLLRFSRGAMLGFRRMRRRVQAFKPNMVKKEEK